MYIAFTVPVRSVLDFAGLAALLPVLMLVLEPEGMRSGSLLSRFYQWGGFESTRHFTLAVCLTVFAIIVLKNGLNLWLGHYQNRYLMELYRYFSERLFTAYYRRGLLFMKQSNTSDLGMEVNYVCYAFALQVLAPLLSMAGEAVLLLLLFGALVWYSPVAAALLLLCFVPVVWLYVRLVRGKLEAYGQAENQAKRRQGRIVHETFKGYSEIEINQAFPFIRSQFREGLLSVASARERTEIMLRIPMYLVEAGVAASIALLVVISRDMESLRLLFGVFTVAALRMLPAIRSLMNGWAQVRNSSYTVEIIAPAMEEETVAAPADETLSFRADETPSPCKTRAEEKPFFTRRVEVCNLTFSFLPGQPVIDRLSFSFRKGERIGIRGASGAGKTTLFNLLLGFYPPVRGEIRVDDRPLTAANRREWQRITGYVPQEVFIVDGSLAENIALGVPPDQIDRPRITRLLEQVQLQSFAASLPQGIDTRVGEAGSRLSGGQKQRIGIARALYKKAEVLFFDEATSALDTATEQEITSAIRSLSDSHRELTILIIAHRESSLAFCDRIIEIKQ